MADQTLEPDADVAGGEEDDFDGNENLADSDDFDSEDEGK